MSRMTASGTVAWFSAHGERAGRSRQGYGELLAGFAGGEDTRTHAHTQNTTALLRKVMDVGWKSDAAGRGTVPHYGDRTSCKMPRALTGRDQPGAKSQVGFGGGLSGLLAGGLCWVMLEEGQPCIRDSVTERLTRLGFHLFIERPVEFRGASFDGIARFALPSLTCT
ncbi:hypothetical protein EV127DRAFT_413686 [Xylaria flabelliformis]|nr:hypothetical protein EV127DRAFT_413686 [Xylaria flabelliformis]